MQLYRKSIRDERVRDYVPVSRVLAHENVSGIENWIDNPGNQALVSDSIARGIVEKNGMVLLDFGIELHGGVRIINLGDQGKIRIRFGESVGEAMGEPDQCHAIHDTELLVPQYGMVEYGNTAFRFVRIDNLGGTLQILNILAVAIYRDLEYAGTFESSDERLNKIWKTAAYTLQLNMQDYLYDGVKRDRLVWMGDMHPEIRGILAAFQDTSLIRKSLDYMVETTPLPGTMNSIRTYSCWWVICLADYYRTTGHLDYIAGHRTYLLELLKMYIPYIASDGSECIPDVRFLDWPNNRNTVAKHAGLQGLLLWMFRAGEELLNALGCDSSFTVEAQQLLKRHIPDCAGSKAAAALQTISGLTDRSDVILNDPFHGVSTFYGFYMLLAQPTHSALDLIRTYWGAMIDRGATTFWEDFNLEWLENSGRIDEFTPPGKLDLHADFGDFCYKGLRHSLCHGWACGPLPFLSERVLGVHFLEPGGKRIRVKPDLGGLEFVSGVYPTPYGGVRVEASRSGTLNIDLPSGIELEESKN